MYAASRRIRLVIGVIMLGLFTSSCATSRYVSHDTAQYRRQDAIPGDFLLEAVVPETLQRLIAPTSHVKIEAEDGTWVACDVHDSRHDRVLVISPGFLQHKRSAGIRELIEALRNDFDLIALDYRGTGESSGRYGFSAKEQADLHTVLHFAERRWHKVGVIGISLGAAIAINELADHPHAQSLVTISAPMAFAQIEKRVPLKISWEATVEASTEIRSGYPFLPKRDPVAVIDRLTTPILLIHGSADRVVFARHSRNLFARAPGHKELFLLPHAGHAHELILAHLSVCVTLIREWFEITLR